MLEKCSGIYAIVHIQSGRRYVGSAIDLRKRWNGHKRLLSLGRHHSRHLQRAWIKYGAQSFTFLVIEHCIAAALIEREQHYIDERAEFNCSPIAGSPLGVKHSAETKAKVTAALKRRMNEPREIEKCRQMMLKEWSAPDGRAKRMTALNSQETKQKMRESGERQMSDPTRLAKQLAAMNSPEARAKRAATMAIRMKEKWADPVYREKIVAACSSPEARAKNSAAKRRWLANPDNRAILSAATKKQMLDPAMRARTSAGMKRAMSDPALVKRLVAAMHTPEALAKSSITKSESLKAQMLESRIRASQVSKEQ